MVKHIKAEAKDNAILELLRLKDAIANKRHKEKLEFANTRYSQGKDLSLLRFELATKMLKDRDGFAKQRHSERINLIYAVSLKRRQRN